MVADFETFSKESKVKYWTFFLFICLAGFGIYFVYDLPGSIGIDFKSKTGLDDESFMSTFYLLYSYPSAVSAILSGYFIDSVFGLGLSGIVFSILALAGQALILCGLHFSTPWLMGLGRFLHGTASEPLGVVRAAYNIKYFGSALQFGLVLAASRSGSVGGFQVFPRILCMFYPGAPTCQIEPEKKADSECASGDEFVTSNITVVQNITGEATSRNCEDNPDVDCDQLGTALQYCVLVGMGMVSLAICVMFALDRVDKAFDRAEEKKTGRAQENKKREMLKPSDLKNIPVSVWLMIAVFMLFYCSVFPFNSMLPDYFKAKLGFDKAVAANLSSIVYAFSVIGAPIFGGLIDKTGHHPIWVTGSCAGLALSEWFWGFYVNNFHDGCDENSNIQYVLFGLMVFNAVCYSVVASGVMPWLARMVQPNLKATTMGVLMGIQQIGVGTFSWLLGKFVKSYGWNYFPHFAGCASAIAAIFSAIVWYREGSDPYDSYTHEEDVEEAVELKGNDEK